MRSESEIQQLIQMEVARYGCILLRNNSGALKDNRGRLVRYGLGNVSSENNKRIKSSDLIGITPTVITPEMVGQLVGIFTATEVKAEGWKYKGTPREVAQKNFIEWIKAKGGIAGFCNSVDSAVELLRR